MAREIRLTVKRGTIHKQNVGNWIHELQTVGEIGYIPDGVEFVEHTGFDESVRGRMLGMTGDILVGYLIAMNEREEIRAK